MYYNRFALQKSEVKGLKILSRAQNRTLAANVNSPPPLEPSASERANAHEVVKVHDADHLVVVDNQKRLNLVAYLLERFRDQRVRRDGAGRRVMTATAGVSREKPGLR